MNIFGNALKVVLQASTETVYADCFQVHSKRDN